MTRRKRPKPWRERDHGAGQVCGENHPAAKLTEARVIVIRVYARHGLPLTSLSKRYRVALSTISQAAHGVTWKCMTYPLAVPVNRSGQNRRAALAKHRKWKRERG